MATGKSPKIGGDWKAESLSTLEPGKTSPKQGKSRGRLGRANTTVQQNYSTIIFHTYIPYNDLKH